MSKRPRLEARVHSFFLRDSLLDIDFSDPRHRLAVGGAMSLAYPDYSETCWQCKGSGIVSVGGRGRERGREEFGFKGFMEKGEGGG